MDEADDRARILAVCLSSNVKERLLVAGALLRFQGRFSFAKRAQDKKAGHGAVRDVVVTFLLGPLTDFGPLAWIEIEPNSLHCFASALVVSHRVISRHVLSFPLTRANSRALVRGFPYSRCTVKNERNEKTFTLAA